MTYCTTASGHNLYYMYCTLKFEIRFTPKLHERSLQIATLDTETPSPMTYRSNYKWNEVDVGNKPVLLLVAESNGNQFWAPSRFVTS